MLYIYYLVIHDKIVTWMVYLKKKKKKKKMIDRVRSRVVQGNKTFAYVGNYSSRYIPASQHIFIIIIIMGEGRGGEAEIFKVDGIYRFFTD